MVWHVALVFRNQLLTLRRETMVVTLLRILDLFLPVVLACIVHYMNRAGRVVYGWQSPTGHNVDT